MLLLMRLLGFSLYWIQRIDDEVVSRYFSLSLPYYSGFGKHDNVHSLKDP